VPPRYAYWTIIVDDQPTAFRAGALEDIMPTFNRLKEKQPTAKLMWFQSGKLWPSRLDAREAMQMRGERGRDRDPRQAREARATGDRPEWKPKAPFKSSRDQARSNWKPKPFTAREEKPEWKPKGSFTPHKPEWKPRGAAGVTKSAWKPKSEKLEWKPKGSAGTRRDEPSGSSEQKRKWVPKAEYKKSQGIEAKKDDKWRPGGEHRDPKQKYKDAKKAKWTRFKQAIRSRATKKREP
jgi:hypothetical protein